MAILTCAIPAFPLALLTRAEPALIDQALAVLGPDDRVLASTAAAVQAGVRPGQTARQVRVICPEVEIRSADLAACQAEFEEVLSLLDDMAPRVEPAGLGRAFLDAPGLDETTAPAFCQDVGRRVRREFGAALQPAVGCDSGKFTALAAASHTRPGAVRVVMGQAERPFLRPLSVRLLPLPSDSQWRLHLLGIRDLGQYADLPPRAVLQQFGNAGRLAQRWAQGQDDRPVVPRAERPTLTAATEFEAPLDALPPLLMAATRLLERPLTQLSDRFQAAQVVSATREWSTGGKQTDRWRLPTPTAERRRLLQLLADRWQGQAWEGAVVGLTLTLSEIQDTWAEQMSLFPTTGDSQENDAWLKSFQMRHGAERILQARVQQPTARRVEKRTVWRAVAS